MKHEDNKIKDLEWMNSILSKSELTEKDAERIGHKIKKEMAKRLIKLSKRK